MTMDNFVDTLLEEYSPEVELIDKKFEETSSEDLAILKKVNFSSGEKYYAKIHSNTGKLFNVISDNLDEFDKKYKGSKIYIFKFKEINKVTHTLYKEYINTKNTYLYNQANKHKFM